LFKNVGGSQLRAVSSILQLLPERLGGWVRNRRCARMQGIAQISDVVKFQAKFSHSLNVDQCAIRIVLVWLIVTKFHFIGKK